MGLAGALLREAEVRSHAQRGRRSAPASASAGWFAPFFKEKFIFLVVFKANDSHGRLTFAVYFSGLFRFCGKRWTLCAGLSHPELTLEYFLARK